MSGQNPTNEEVDKMLQEAVDLGIYSIDSLFLKKLFYLFIKYNFQGTHMLMFNDIIPIVEKYWKNYDNYVDDMKKACSAFGISIQKNIWSDLKN
jgi:hypothetical protein